MKTLKQMEIDFWKKTIKKYLKFNENSQINDVSLISVKKIPSDITVSKKLSDKITISISNNHKTESGFFYFSFFYEKSEIFGVFSSYRENVRLFNNIYENFEKDNAEIKKILKPIKEKEQDYLSAVTSIKMFVTNMMNDTGYKWQLDEHETMTSLQIKLNSPRIIEIEIHHKAFNKHPELFDKDKILNSITKIDDALKNNYLAINIINKSSKQLY